MRILRIVRSHRALLAFAAVMARRAEGGNALAAFRALLLIGFTPRQAWITIDRWPADPVGLSLRLVCSPVEARAVYFASRFVECFGYAALECDWSERVRGALANAPKFGEGLE